MRKLKLSRETLRQLDPERLQALAGGIRNMCDNTSPTNDRPYNEPCQGGGAIPTQQITICLNANGLC